MLNLLLGERVPFLSIERVLERAQVVMNMKTADILPAQRNDMVNVMRNTSFGCEPRSFGEYGFYGRLISPVGGAFKFGGVASGAICPEAWFVSKVPATLARLNSLLVSRHPSFVGLLVFFRIRLAPVLAAFKSFLSISSVIGSTISYGSVVIPFVPRLAGLFKFVRISVIPFTVARTYLVNISRVISTHCRSDFFRLVGVSLSKVLSNTFDAFSIGSRAQRSMPIYAGLSVKSSPSFIERFAFFSDGYLSISVVDFVANYTSEIGHVSKRAMPMFAWFTGGIGSNSSGPSFVSSHAGHFT